jgi:hypothetical protein
MLILMSASLGKGCISGSPLQVIRPELNALIGGQQVRRPLPNIDWISIALAPKLGTAASLEHSLPAVLLSAWCCSSDLITKGSSTEAPV